MLDANANRAAEALRVLEDLARFVAVDAPLSAEAKRLRHAVRALFRQAGLDPAQSIAWRDTPADVGVPIKADDEGRRASPADLAAAASSRATEALRVIEESLKLLPAHGLDRGPHLPAGAPPWRHAEAIRYAAYELAKRLALLLPLSPAPQWRLCVLITPTACRLNWIETARRAIDGGEGADCLQLREKNLPDAELLRAAEQLRTLTQSANPRTALIINDRPDVALLVGADGVHLGQFDLPVEHVRRLAGRSLLVGVSTHDMNEAHAAAAAGADVCGVGAMFTTETKPRPVSGPDYLRRYLADERTAPIPHLAIGGITPTNIHELVAAGCRGVAVSSVVCRSDHPERICRELRQALDSGSAQGRRPDATA